MDIPQSLLDTGEKFIRNITPGLYILCLTIFDRIPYSEFSSIPDASTLIFIAITIGPIVYSVYRLVMEFVDYIIIWRYLKQSKSVQTVNDYIAKTSIYLYKNQADSNRELRDYTYYKFGSTHVCIMVSIITLTYQMFLGNQFGLNLNGHKCPIMVISFILLILSAWNYLKLHSIQRILMLQAEKA